jgi:hypothetical protein
MSVSTVCHALHHTRDLNLQYSVHQLILPYVGKAVCKNFSNSSYVTLYARMLLGPSYFAWGHIHVDGSVYVPHQQIEDC